MFKSKVYKKNISELLNIPCPELNPEFIAWYDGTCPICTGFTFLLKKKLPASQIEFRDLYTDPEAPSDKSHFCLQKGDQLWLDQEAIKALSENFPQVKDFVWMLPERYQFEAIDTIWRAASWMRKKMHQKWSKDHDCDCMDIEEEHKFKRQIRQSLNQKGQNS
jgi:predicted DCC family thiol-disulfide oxidoreductase YuxK